MAVYTKVSDEKLKDHLRKYSIGEAISFKGIEGGIDNSNFVLQTDRGKFVLTIFEGRIKSEDLPYFINLKAHFSSKGICCPAPILGGDGSVIVDILGKKSVIASFLEGSFVDQITENHCFEVGKTLARLHLAAQGFLGFRKNDLGFDGWNSLFGKFEHLINDYKSGLKEELLNHLQILSNQYQKLSKLDLPSAACHLDLFPDNVFFDSKGNLNGVIDFYFAANDYLIYDLAIAITAWCFDEKNIFNEAFYLKMIEGYEAIRALESKERSVINIMLMGSSMRFLLTRLNDMFFTPKDSLVSIKDPMIYLERMRFFGNRIASEPFL